MDAGQESFLLTVLYGLKDIVKKVGIELHNTHDSFINN